LQRKSLEGRSRAREWAPTGSSFDTQCFASRLRMRSRRSSPCRPPWELRHFGHFIFEADSGFGRRDAVAVFASGSSSVLLSSFPVASGSLGKGRAGAMSVADGVLTGTP
jgi:hypothetical protein